MNLVNSVTRRTDPKIATRKHSELGRDGNWARTVAWSIAFGEIQKIAPVFNGVHETAFMPLRSGKTSVLPLFSGKIPDCSMINYNGKWFARHRIKNGH